FCSRLLVAIHDWHDLTLPRRVTVRARGNANSTLPITIAHCTTAALPATRLFGLCCLTIHAFPGPTPAKRPACHAEQPLLASASLCYNAVLIQPQKGDTCVRSLSLKRHPSHSACSFVLPGPTPRRAPTSARSRAPCCLATFSPATIASPATRC